MRTIILLAFTFTTALAQVANAEEQNQANSPPPKNRSKALPPAPDVAPKVQGHATGAVKAIPPRVNTWQRPPSQIKVPRQFPPNANQYVQPKQRVPNTYPPQTIGKQPLVKPAVVAVQPAPNQRTRNWDNDRPRDRHDTGGNRWTNRPQNLIPWREACHRHPRNHHQRDWWRSHYTRFCLFGTGYYFWDAGYWYPAYGYDVSYNNYPYEAPIVAYADMEPAEVIASVQTELQRLGYYQYEADGLMGPETQSALADFQRDNGLEITSAIDEPTLELLGLE